MSLLLDTHVVLWLLAGDPRCERVRDRLAEPREPVLVSAASIWEVAIKSALGKLEAPDDLPEHLEQFAFERLPITDRHAWTVRELSDRRSDPFDRLLAAQARCERAAIVSADPVFDDYGVERVW